MDVFSLEEEEYGDIFITQSDKVMDESDDGSDFEEKNESGIGNSVRESGDCSMNWMDYSDISDDESEVFQSSQVNISEMSQSSRLVE